MPRGSLLGCVLALGLPLTIPRTSPAPHILGSLAVAAPHGPLFAHSRFPLRVDGAGADVSLALVGAGRLDGDTYVAPDVVDREATATVLAATNDASGSVTLTLVPWPAGQAVFAVASYDDGVALHRANDGALLGILALAGGVGDVAQLGSALVAPSTTAPVLWTVDLATGDAHEIADVPTGNEVATLGAVALVTNRDVQGDGALTRIDAGVVSRIRTGVTAEGLAIDSARRLAYVANVNDPSIAVVDVAAMRVTRRLPAPERAFSVALDPASGRIDVVSNVPRTPARPGGSVESIELSSGRVVTRSAPFRFPVGVVLDSRRRRLFVTDEADGTVAVLDARSLRPIRKPLRACPVAWRPAIDALRQRLYVPCARADDVAAYDLRSLRPLAGSPFKTGGYPLAVSVVSRLSGPSR